MTLDEKVHGLRLHVIQRAAQLANVSRACREAGISRALFYRWRERLERYGQDGVHPRRHRARPTLAAPLALLVVFMLECLIVLHTLWPTYPSYVALLSFWIGVAPWVRWGPATPSAHHRPGAHCEPHRAGH